MNKYIIQNDESGKQFILSLANDNDIFEWQGEKRELGGEVVEGVDFEFGNKDKNDCCPECGCEEYECEDYLGKGFRNCKSCGQEWWLDVKYSSRFCKVAIPLSKAEEVKEMGDGWIRVEDMLPEKRGYYLCFDTNFGSEQPIDVLFFQPYNQSWYYKADTYHPQFWRTLPPPPKS